MTVTNWTAALLPDVTGKTFIVTGATSGLGKATADAVARAGAHVVLAVRNHAKGQPSRKPSRETPRSVNLI
jgi:NAD(P)-dependent dehydrogenase (short-subunit alcohol dehydrogenase family)